MARNGIKRERRDAIDALISAVQTHQSNGKNSPLIPNLMPLYPAEDWDNSRWTVRPIRPKVFMVVSILLESLMSSEVMRQKPQP